MTEHIRCSECKFRILTIEEIKIGKCAKCQKQHAESFRDRLEELGDEDEG